MYLRNTEVYSSELTKLNIGICCLNTSNVSEIYCLLQAWLIFLNDRKNYRNCNCTCYSSTYETPRTPPLPDVLGTHTHISTTRDTPLDMTVTRSSRPPPSYSQSLVNNQNAPARPSVITCAPPATTSWGDQSSDVKSTNRDESGRQGHRRELLSGEFVLYCVLETEMCRHAVMHKNMKILSVIGVFYMLNCQLNFKNVIVFFILVCCLKLNT